MFCPTCKKGFPDALRMCPECFADLALGSSEPVTAVPSGSEGRGRSEGPAPRPTNLQYVPRPEAPDAPRPVARAPRIGPCAPPGPGKDLAGFAAILCALVIGLFVLASRGQGQAPPRVAEQKAFMDSTEADGWLDEARQLYDSGDFAASARLAEKALERYREVGSRTQEVKARELLAASYYKLRDYARSTAHYRALTEARPESREYRQALRQAEEAGMAQQRLKANEKLEQAQAELRKGNAEDAARLAREALTLYQENRGTNSNLASAYTVIGKSYSDQGVTEQAAIYLKQAVAADPHHREARVALRQVEGSFTTPAVAMTSPPPDSAAHDGIAVKVVKIKVVKDDGPAPLPQSSYPKAKPRASTFPYPIEGLGPGDPREPGGRTLPAPPARDPETRPYQPPNADRAPMLPRVNVPRPSSFPTYDGYNTTGRREDPGVLPSYDKPSQTSLQSYSTPQPYSKPPGW